MTNTNLSTISNAEFVTFENTDLRVINRDGNVWLSAADLSRALGYKNAHAVSKVYDRNSHEFAGDMTQVITLQANEINVTPKLGVTPAHGKTVRVFSSRGCHLIAMLSRTEKAGMFRRWVLDVLENLNQQPAAKPSAPQYLPNADHLSLRDTMMHPDAFEQIVNMAGKLVDSECISEDDRDSVKRARNMAAQRLEHLQLDPMLGLRLLVESDHLGGFKTSVVPDNAYMLLDSKLADYIRSAEGPRLKFLPDIIHACTERLDELYNLPLAQFKDDEGNL